MGLQVHRGERTDTLAAALAAVLAEPVADPFAPDLVAVPARGVERWLRQRLSHRLGARAAEPTGLDPAGLVPAGLVPAGLVPAGLDPAGTDRIELLDGVCLNIEMPSPAALFTQVQSQALQLDPDQDPWRADRLRWQLLRGFDLVQDADWAAELATHLGYRDPDGVGEEALELRRGRRLAVATRLARLFESYAAQRPRLISDWAAGSDTDGFGRPLGEQHRWQPELFRAVAGLIGQPNPAELLPDTLAAVRRDPATLDLPPRLSLFGPTRLSSAELQLLVALAEHRQVHLWLPHPSPGGWQRLAAALEAGELGGTGSGDNPRGASPIADLIANPLLRSLGRDTGELQVRLAEAIQTAGATARYEHHQPVRHDQPVGHDQRAQRDSTDAPGTALQILQSALRDDAPHPGRPDLLAPHDRSIQVHACHGRPRQVEVLRDEIVRLLADDPTLQPRDILIMCPDIEAFAPLLLGAFGASDLPEAHPGQRLRLRLADRSLRQTNPVLSVLARLLELAGGRMMATDVLDLAAMAPVRRRFRFREDQLEELHRWVRAANIRWGLTGADRKAFGLDRLAEGTWHLGLDSWLLGIAMDPADHAAAMSGWPLEGVESAQVDLIGRFTEFIHRLVATLRDLDGVRPLTDWLQVLHRALDELTEVESAAGWQRLQADRLLASTAHTAASPGRGEDAAPLLRHADLVDLLSDELQGRPTRASFRSGDLTACSMVPMRSVPHRVIALLGVDEEDLPRAQGVDGDDALTVEPRIGERDVAAEDRQLLLDAVLAATDHLLICYSGADQRTGARRPPAVPLGELLDDLDARLSVPDGSARDLFVTEHPLQPFDRRNFVAADPLRSFDAAALAGATAAAGRAERPPGRRRFLTSALAVPDEPEIDLADLQAFYRHPVRHFLRRRLGLQLRDFSEELDPDLPLQTDALQAWAIGDRLLKARLAGVSAQAAALAETRRGDLPPAALGAAQLRQIGPKVDTILKAAREDLAADAQSLEVSLTLDDGRLLRGALHGVRAGHLVRVQYGTVRAGHRLHAWLSLLLAAVGAPGRVETAIVRGSGGRGFQQRAPQPQTARALLADLVAGYEAGLREPLPLPVKTGEVYAAGRRQDHPAAEADAIEQWSVKHPENTDPEWAATFGTSWAELTAARQLSDLTWPVTACGESHWFGRIARTVFDPMLAHERGLR